MPRRNIVEEVMYTKVLYGGLIATRAEVQVDLEASFRSHGCQKPDWLMVDRLVFKCPEATPEQVADLEARGMTLKALRSG